ncbi:MAG: aldo/keto reductase [Atopobiaceae bacterium]|jgi:predicted aldo/keto reductase-like oxidoreductase
MGYKENYLGADTPKLGFGMMRLPKLEDGSPDVGLIKKMVDTFMAAGFTYFDTAYVYGDGASEKVTGEALVKRYPRDAYTVATKANAWLGNPTEEEVKRQFEISRERLGLDYFDYYLLHAIQANNDTTYEKYGLWDWARNLKEEGLVKHWGFSFHSSPEHLKRLLDAHPDVDFIQLQINYADWNQDRVWSRQNMEVAREHGVPFTVMEPVKGGILATPPRKVREILDAAPSQVGAGASYASWAIRFAASLPGVITVLSGMSTLEQVEDNISYMAPGTFAPLSDAELAAVSQARTALEQSDQIRCTACHYCCDGCPVQIPIPEFFSAMNRKLVFEDETGAKKSYAAAAEKAGVSAADCIGCGQCESACPQGLSVISYLQDVAQSLM